MSIIHPILQLRKLRVRMGFQTYRAAASRWLWRAATPTFLEPSRLRDAADQRPCRESGTLGGAERERGGAGWWVERGWLRQPLRWTPRPLPGPVGRRKPEASPPREGGSVSKGNHTSTLDKQRVAPLRELTGLIYTQTQLGKIKTQNPG